MTAPLELEIEEPEALPWSHLVRVACVRRCGKPALADPSQVSNALCGPCRIAEASAAATISRLPAETPPPMVRGGYAVLLAPRAAERSLRGCPICATARTEAACTFTGRTEPEQREMCASGCGHVRPGPVSDLFGAALLAGWAAEVRHTKPRDPIFGKDAWSVRFRRGGRWAGYAVRRGDVWTSVCITGHSLPPFLALGVTELRQWLADPEGCGDAWTEVIRQRVAASALHTKQVRCPGSPRCVLIGPVRAPGVPVIGPEHTHRADGSIVKKVSRKEAVQGV